MSKDIYEVLERCLQSLERGGDMDRVLLEYPEFAEELRPLLEASIKARAVSLPAPSALRMRQGRVRLLQKAVEMRHEKAPLYSRRSVTTIFQRMAVALGLTIAFLFSGTTLVSASSAALPGENLYTVKRTWENVRLLLVFDTNVRGALRSEFEQERLHEVNELLMEGRHETIQFAGIYMQNNGRDYVSGVPVLFLPDVQIPSGLANGIAVIITGRTNADGFVVLETIALLPPGSIVPLGAPIEVESENDESSESILQPESGPSSGQDAGNTSQPNFEASGQDKFQIEGTIDSMQGNQLMIDGQIVYLDHAEVQGVLQPGVNVEAEGYYASDGKFIVTKIKVEEPESGDGREDGLGSGSVSDSEDDGSGGGSDDSGSSGDSGLDDHEGSDSGPGGGG